MSSRWPICSAQATLLCHGSSLSNRLLNSSTTTQTIHSSETRSCLAVSPTGGQGYAHATRPSGKVCVLRRHEVQVRTELQYLVMCQDRETTRILLQPPPFYSSGMLCCFALNTRHAYHATSPTPCLACSHVQAISCAALKLLKRIEPTLYLLAGKRQIVQQTDIMLSRSYLALLCSSPGNKLSTTSTTQTIEKSSKTRSSASLCCSSRMRMNVCSDTEWLCSWAAGCWTP